MSLESSLMGLAPLPGFQQFNWLMEGTPFVFFLAVVFLLVFLAVKGKRGKAALFVSLILTAVLSTLLKQFYAEPRPCSYGDYASFTSGCDGFGFPSSHAALFFALAMPTFGTRAFYGFILLAAVVSLSRVISGVHSVPQVVAGMVLGFAVGTFSSYLVQAMHWSYEEVRQRVKVK